MLEPAFADVVPQPGMKQSVDRRLAPPGVLTYAQNVRWEAGGRIRKRGGVEQLGPLPSTPTSPGAWLHERLCCIGKEIYRQDGQGTSGDWRVLGYDPCFTPERRIGLSADEYGGALRVSLAMVALTVPVAVAAYEVGVPGPSTALHIVGLNAKGERQWFVKTPDGDQDPRLVVVGTTCYLLWRTSINDLKIAQLTVSGSSAGTLGSPTTLASSVTHYDATPLNGGSNWLLAYHAGTPAASVFLRVVSGISTTVSSYNFAAVATPGDITIVGWSGEKIWMAFRDGGAGSGNLRARIFDNALTLIGSAIVVSAESSTEFFKGQPTIGRISATEAMVCVSAGLLRLTTPAVSNIGVRAARLVSGTGVVAIVDSYGWALASRLFPSPASEGAKQRVLVQSYLDTYSDSRGLGARHGILEIDLTNTSPAPSGEILALSFEREAAGYVTGSLPPAINIEVMLGASPYTVHMVPAGWLARSSPNTSGLIAQDLLLFRSRQNNGSTHAPPGSWRPVAQFGPMTYIGGGTLTATPPGGTLRYSPIAGFPVNPVIRGDVVAGGSLTTGVVYTYVATFEHIDELGQRWQSEPSLPITTSPTGANLTSRIAICVPGGSKRSGIAVHIWRQWAGGAYHRVTPDAGAPQMTTPTGEAAFGIATAFDDTMSDATAAAREQLQTGPNGLLPPAPASGARCLCVGDGRMFVRSWDPRVVWVSRTWVPGEGCQFVDDDVFRIFYPEDIVALAYLDGTLVALAERSIYVTNGLGPTDQGTDPYPAPQRLPVDAGCTDERSVLVTSKGVIYQSPRGLMILPRGFGPPVYIGADVASELEALPYVLGVARSVTRDGSELVHIAIAPSHLLAQTTQAKVLVLDLELMAWSVDVLGYGAAAIGTRGGRFQFVTGSGHTSMVRWMPDTTTVRTDREAQNAEVWIELRLQFGHLRPFGLLGTGTFNALRLFVEYAGECGLTVQSTLDEGFDVDDQPEVRSWILPGGLATSPGNPIVLGIQPGRDSGTALALDIFDVQPAGFPSSGQGDSFTLHALAMQSTGDGALRRLPEEAMQ